MFVNKSISKGIPSILFEMRSITIRLLHQTAFAISAQMFFFLHCVLKLQINISKQIFVLPFPDLQVIAAVGITDATMYVLAECKDVMDLKNAQTFQTSIIVVSIETVLSCKL